MALSDKKILAEKERGNIVIEPFTRDNLSTSSYDLTLGEWYFREQKRKPGNDLYNIYDKTHTDFVWGTEARRARPAREVLKDFNIELNGINERDQVILVHPGETILAHTIEFIGGKNCITTMMKARSSLGRSFVEVCKCAGWGDVGYVNRWTMEITNNSTQYIIPLVVGRRIAQLIFFHTGEILSDDYTQAGKYQTVQNMEELKRSWEPSLMLPQLYKDRDIQR